MVVEPPTATTAIHLVPRQVTLAMNASVLQKEKKKTKKATKEKAEESHMDLERIVAMFLHKSGYQKTLDTFRSEVQLKDDDIKGNLDLEDLLRRLVEFCGCNLTSCNEKPLLLKKQEGKKSGVTEDVKLDTGSPVDKNEPPACHDGETIVRSKLKKRKDKLLSDSAGGSSLGVTKDDIENIEKEIDRENLQTETSEDLKGKKKKKNKPTSTSEKTRQFVEKKSDDLKLLVPTKTSQLDEPAQKSKNKKQKPMSDFSASDANQGSEAAREAMKDAEHANINGVSENVSNDIVPEKKVNKKKLNNDIVERLDKGILTELREDNCGHENQTELSNTGTKFETDHVPKEELVNTKSKKSKKKRSTAEGESHSNEKHAAQASEKDTNRLILHQEKKHQSSDARCHRETDIKHSKKKRKTQGAQDDIGTLNTNLGVPSGLLTKQEENGSDGEKTLNLKKCNGIHAKNEIDTPSAKSKESYRKLSAEPKSVKAFQRVKVDEVKFADERLQDNSYWAKDGAEIGYGAKAQEVLGQVKGRDFRHEKTKKKRGSYRGGQIDFNSHSIKFNYSDEE